MAQTGKGNAEKVLGNALSVPLGMITGLADLTVDGLWDAIGRFVDLFTPIECRNYFAAAGYDAT
jgi:hypothetical protein